MINLLAVPAFETTVFLPLILKPSEHGSADVQTSLISYRDCSSTQANEPIQLPSIIDGMTSALRSELGDADIKPPKTTIVDA